MLKRFVQFVWIICLSLIAISSAQTEPFILGADVSWIQEREYYNVNYADNGTVKDIFEILKDHKFNYIRLRLFVDPTAKIPNEPESPYSEKGFCNLENTRIVAKRIKKAGFKFLLDFHYSDTWADPAKQYKPQSWQGLSFNDLKTKVRIYTKETLEKFKADGTLPDMVQVGNEIYAGMIWPDGKLSNMSNFAALVNAGIDGVKDVDKNIKIMIHSISKDSPSNWLKNLINAGVNRIDVFGLSYYSEWHGTPGDLQAKVKEIAANHSVKIAIAEYADNHDTVNKIIYNLPNKKGIGTFVWEPADWNEALFDWVNNRRETNSRIDIYPKLSKLFGNEVGIDHRTVSENRIKADLGFTSGNTLYYSFENINKAELSVFTFNGKLVEKFYIVPGRNLSDGKISTKLNPGSYLIKVKTDNDRTFTFRSFALNQ